MSRWKSRGCMVIDTMGVEPTWVASSRSDAEQARLCFLAVQRDHGFVARYLPRGRQVVDRVTDTVVAECSSMHSALCEAISSHTPGHFASPPREEINASEDEADWWYWWRQAEEGWQHDVAAWIENMREDTWSNLAKTQEG